jgi:RNA polymerase sigma-70 factor, ECF subfamily
VEFCDFHFMKRAASSTSSSIRSFIFHYPRIDRLCINSSTGRWNPRPSACVHYFDTRFDRSNAVPDRSKIQTTGNENPDEVLKHLPALRAYARSLRLQSDDADDLVQTTLMKAIANIDKFTAGTNLRAWLFTIMRNTFLTEVRKHARERPGVVDCASSMPISEPVHDEHIAGQRLMQAIARLPQHYREILLLVVVLGESYEDAARICGCAIGTVKSRVNRARALLIEELGSTDFFDFYEAKR